MAKKHQKGPKFNKPIEIDPVIENPHSLALADLDGDGDLDLFAGRLDSGVKLYIRNGSGDLVDESLARGVPDWIEWNPRGISASDFDQDQDLDIYIASYHISIDVRSIINS